MKSVDEIKKKIQSLKDENGKQTFESIKEIIDNCTFGDWTINLRLEQDRPYIQVTFIDKCEFSGEEEIQACRKWMLSYYMCDTEVVDTAFAAIKRAMEHEVNEKFKFAGRRVYNPHRSIYSLIEISTAKDVDVRK